MDVKPGYKTSEFWLTAIPSVVLILSLAGILPADDVDALVELAKQVILGIGAVVTIVSYIIARKSVKNSATTLEAAKILKAATENKSA